MGSEKVKCPNCGKTNNIPAAGEGKPRCGNCHEPLPWIAAAGDGDFAEIVEKSSVPVARGSVGDVVRPVSHGQPRARAARQRTRRPDQAWSRSTSMLHPGRLNDSPSAPCRLCW